MLRQPHVWASRASPAQKLQGLRVVYSKNFSRATFLFLGTHLVDRFLSYLSVKLWEKRVVCSVTLKVQYSIPFSSLILSRSN